MIVPSRRTAINTAYEICQKSFLAAYLPPVRVRDELEDLNDRDFLDKLLSDRTTGKRIIWATETFRDLGVGKQDEISPAFLCAHARELRESRSDMRVERTRKHGEVVTPLKVCKTMCDHAYKTLRGRDWQKFVRATVLEITCGEAPFLVSRRDLSTGVPVPLHERIGILDRKLKVVSEKTREEKEWLEWAFNAFQSVYGYEFQGFNLLLARINLLRTFEEYLLDKWARKPSEAEYQRLLNIIAWNIWQMDGLTGTIPYKKPAEKTQLLSLFGNKTQNDACRSCVIHDWQENKDIEFRDLGK